MGMVEKMIERSPMKGVLGNISGGLAENVGLLDKTTVSHLESIFGSDLETRFRMISNLSSFVNTNKTMKEIIDMKTAFLKIPLLSEFSKTIKGSSGISLINLKAGISKFFFDGDIDLTTEQISTLSEAMEYEKKMKNRKRMKRQADRRLSSKWPNRTVFYFYDEGFDSVDLVEEDLDLLRAKTCLKFINNPEAKNRIKVFNGIGCHSNIGFQNAGVQNLSLAPDCRLTGIMAHEFIHALGFTHTQQRPDRDDNIIVNFAAVNETEVSNYNMIPNKYIALYTTYEYGSVMQYKADAFSTGKITMIPRAVDYTYTLGSNRLSFLDYVMINDHYKCSELCDNKKRVLCRNGGEPHPKDCSKCICPDGYGGRLCDERPSGCGETLEASPEWQNFTFTIGKDEKRKELRHKYEDCVHWITAPKNKKIHAKIVEFENPICIYGCTVNGVEIKANLNQRETNPRVCCNTFLNITHVSWHNPLPIVSYTQWFFSTITIQYRFVDQFAPLPQDMFQHPDPSTVCADVDISCPTYVSKGFCSGSEYTEEQKKALCPLSCNLCGS